MKKKPTSLDRHIGSKKPSSEKPAGSKMLLENLEPRILYSAAPVDGGSAPDAELGSEPAQDAPDVVSQSEQSSSQSQPVAQDNLDVTTESVLETEVYLLGEESGEFAAPIESDAEENAMEVIGESLLEVDEWGQFSDEAQGSELSPDVVNWMAEAAAERWRMTGLTEEQSLALNNVVYQVVDLPGDYLGLAENNIITIDIDAAGRTWFFDETPLDDEEYISLSEGDTQMIAVFESAADNRLDLLSVLMHEQGHIMGLEESADSASIMYQVFETSERRVPMISQAEGAAPGSLDGEHFALAAVDEVILSTDFTDRVVSGTTASNITWTTNGVQDPGDLTVTEVDDGSEELNGFHDTVGAEGHFAPDLNIHTEGTWQVSVPIVLTEPSITLTRAILDVQAFSNSGITQVNDMDFTVEVFGTSSGSMLVQTVENTSAAGEIAFDFPAPLRLSNGESYELRISSVGQGGGNNSGLDAVSVYGLVHPSSTIFTLDFEDNPGSSLFISGGSGASSVDNSVAALGATNNTGAGATDTVWGMKSEVGNEFSTATLTFNASSYDSGAALAALNALTPGDYQLVTEYDQYVVEKNAKFGLTLNGVNGGSGDSRGGANFWRVHNVGHGGLGSAAPGDDSGDNAFSHVSISTENNAGTSAKNPAILTIVAPGETPTGVNVFEQGQFSSMRLEFWNTGSGDSSIPAEIYYDNISFSAIALPAVTDPLVNLTFDADSASSGDSLTGTANSGSLGGNATVSGSLTYADSTVTGELAAQFDENNNVVTYSIPAGTIGIDSDFTVAASVYIDGNQSQYDRILDPFFEFDDNTTAVTFKSTEQTIYRTGALGAGWHHLALTFDADASPTTGRGVVRAYVDGIEVAANTNALRPDFSAGLMLNLGAQESGNRPMTGRVDDVVFYNSLVLPDDIAAIANPVRAVYVNDSWTNQSDITNGDGDLEAVGTQTATFGNNAFGTLQDAVDAIDTLRDVTLIVNEGDYSGETLDLSAFSNDITVKFVEGNSTLGGLIGGDNVTIELGGVDGVHNDATTLAIESGDFSGVLSGIGELTKTGSGVLTLGGENTYTGSVVVESGRLILDGGTMGTVIQQGGTVQIGADDAVDSATIEGNYELQVGGILEVDFFGADDANSRDAGTVDTGNDYLIVNGDVTLAGELSLNYTLPNDVTTGDQFTIIKSTGTISGAFSNGTVTVGGYTFEVQVNDFGVDGSDVVLVAVNDAPELSNVQITSGDEGTQTRLSGTILDAEFNGDGYTIAVDWADPNDSGTKTYDLADLGANGTYNATTGEFELWHTYADDDPSSDSSNTYTVNVQVTETLGYQLQALYGFDAGNANDSTTNNNDGSTIHGSGIAFIDDPERGGVVSGSGTGYIEVPHSDSLGEIDDQLTVSFWIKAEAPVDDQAINKSWFRFLRKGNESGSDGTPTWFINRSGSTDQVNIRVDTFPNDDVTGDHNQNLNYNRGGAVLDGNWHHVTYVLDNGTSSEYIDGSLNHSQTYRHGNGLSNTDVLQLLGKSTADAINGLMDDIGIWSRALSGDEVGQLFGGATIPTENIFSQTVSVTTTVSNAAPVISVGTGDSNAETLSETDAGISASGTLTVTDAGVLDTEDLTVESVLVTGDANGIADATLQGMLGFSSDSLTLDASGVGTIDWDFSSGSEAFDHLADGESLMLAYTIRATDDDTGFGEHTVTITINGTNDAPEAHADTDESVEAGGESNGIAAVNAEGNVITGVGTTNGGTDFDVDTDDDPSADDGSVLVVSAQYSGGGTPVGGNSGGQMSGETVVDGQYGFLTIQPNGSYVYTLDDNTSDTLAEDEFATDEFTYRIANETPEEFALLDIEPNGGQTATNAISINGYARNTSGNLSEQSFISQTGQAFSVAIDAAGTGSVDWRDRRADGSADSPVDLGEDFIKNNHGIIEVTLGTLPAGTYLATSYHRDPQFEQSDTIKVLVNNGDGSGLVDTGQRGTAGLSAPGVSGLSEENLAATAAHFTFTADGTNDVIIRFDGTEGTNKAETPLNGLQLFYLPDVNAVSASTLTVMVQGSNDAPEITGGPDSAELTETNAGLSTSGSLTVTDPDQSDIVTGAVSLAVSGDDPADPSRPSDAELLAMFSVDPATPGQWLSGSETTKTLNWTFDSGSQAFDYLPEGQSLVLTYTLTATDDAAAPLSDSETVTITITGTNDVPVATADTDEATEAGGDGNSTPAENAEGNVLTGTGTTNGGTDVDADFNDDVAVVTIEYSGGGSPLGTNGGGTVDGETIVDGQYGRLTIRPDGSYTYVPDQEATDHLATGQSVSDVFTYGSANEQAQQILIDIQADGGRTADGAISVEGGANFAGNEGFVDRAYTTANGLSFTLSIEDTNAIGNDAGSVDWRDRGDSNLTSDLAKLAEDFVKNSSGIIRVTLGELPAGTYEVTSYHADAQHTQSEAIQVLVDNGDGNGLVNTGQTGNANVAFGGVNGLTDADVESTAAQFSFVADGTNDVIILFDGTAASDRETPLSGLLLNFIPTVAPESESTLTITVNGTNDVPQITVETASGDADSAALTEGNGTLSASDTLTVSDPDFTDTVSAEVTGVTVANGQTPVSNGDLEAMLTVAPAAPVNGSATSGQITWTFNSNSERFDHLSDGEVLTLEYTVEANDSQGGVDEHTVTITITGTNDAPVVVDDTAATTEDAAAIDIDVLANDTDADSGDTKTVVELNGSTTLTGLSELGAAVSHTGGGIFSYDATSAAALQALADGETVEDTFTYTMEDSSGEERTATVRITVTGEGAIEIDTRLSMPDTFANRAPGDDGTVDTVSVALNASGDLEIQVNGTLLRTVSATVLGNTPDLDIQGSGDVDAIAIGDLGVGNFANVTINANGGADMVTFSGSSASSFSGLLSVNAETINLNADITATGFTLSATGGTVTQLATATLDSGSGTIEIDADGAVNLAGTVKTTGNLDIDAGTGTISLPGADVSGKIALVTSGDASLENATGIDFATTTIGGDLNATATIGDITNTGGALTVGGMADFNATTVDPGRGGIVNQLPSLANVGGFWDFEGGTPLADKSSNGNDLTQSGTTDQRPVIGAVSASGNGWAPTNLGNSATFNGNDYLDIPASAYTGDDFTFTIAGRSNTGTWRVMLASDDLALLNHSGSLRLRTQSPSDGDDVVSGIYTDNDWYLTTMRYTKATGLIEVFVSTNTGIAGEPVLMETWLATNPIEKFRIGGDGISGIGGFDGWRGELDFIAFHNEALDDSEVQQMFSKFTTGNGNVAAVNLGGDGNTLEVGGALGLTTGSATINSVGAIDFKTSNVSELDVVASGAISNTAGTVTATGLASLIGTSIDLGGTNAVVFGDLLSLTSAGNASVTNNGDLALGASTIGGDLSARANGSITDSGTVAVTGGAQFASTQVDADLELDQLAVSGSIGLNTTGSGGNALIVNTGTIDFSSTDIGGDLDVTATSGNITNEGGTVSVAGMANFQATGGAGDLSALTAVWDFDGSDPLADKYGNGYTLSAAGSSLPTFVTATDSGNGWTPSELADGNVAQFDNSQNVLSIPNSVYSGGSFTFSVAQMRTNPNYGYDTLLGSNRFRYQNVSGNLQGQLTSPGGTFGGSEPLTAGDWYLITLRYDHTDKSLESFVTTKDGTIADGPALTGSASGTDGLSNATDFRIGGDGSSGIGSLDSFEGQLDFASFHDGLLTDEQLEEMLAIFQVGYSHESVIELGGTNTLAVTGEIGVETNGDATVVNATSIDLKSTSSIGGAFTATATTGDVTVNHAVTMGGDYILTGEDVNFTSTVDTGTHTLTITNTGTGEAQGIVSGEGNLVKAGSGTWTLSQDNTYSGDTSVIETGTLEVTQPSALPGTASVSTDATLHLLSDGINDFDNAFSGDGRILVTLSGASGNTSLLGANSGFTGLLELETDGSPTGNKLSGNPGLDASATIRINEGTQLFSSGTIVSKIEVSGSGNTETRGAIRLNGSLSGQITLLGDTILGIQTTNGTISGDIVNGTAGPVTLTIGAPNQGAGNVNITGKIEDGVGMGVVSLEKVGAGTLTLSGDNSYSGTTVIVDGTVVAGSDTGIGSGDLYFGSSDASSPATTTVGALDLSAFSAAVSNLYFFTHSPLHNVVTIGAGKTLTVGDGTTPVDVIFGPNIAGGSTTNVLFTGEGSLDVNGNGSSLFQLGGATGSNYGGATVDMSDLASADIDLGSSGTLRVGFAGNSGGGAASTLILADTSTVTAATISVGAHTGGVAMQRLHLGSIENTLNANTILVGPGDYTGTRSSGTLDFGTSSGSVTIRGAAGGSSRADLQIANGTTGTSGSPTGTVDFLDHGADLLIDDLIIGGRDRGSGGTTATLSFNQGSLDVTSLTMSNRKGSNVSGQVTSILNLEGGTATFGAIAMGLNSSSATSANGGATATINVSGGTVNVTGGISLASATGSVDSVSSGTLNLIGGEVNVGGDITVDAAGIGTQNAVIDLKGATLSLGGNDIGTLANPIGTFTFTSGRLEDVGEFNRAYTQTGGDLQIGGDAATGTMEIAGDLTTSSGDLEVDIIDAITDVLQVDGNATLGGTLTVTGVSPDRDVYLLIDLIDNADTLSGVFTNANVSGAIVDVGGVDYEIVYNGGDGNDVMLVKASPTIVYVNDQWSSLGDGIVVDGDLETTGTAEDAVVGYTAFGSIQAAVNALGSNSGTIIVNGGDYSSDAVDLNATVGNVALQLVNDSENTESTVTIGSLQSGSGDTVVLGQHGTAVHLTVGNSTNSTISGVISGSGSLTKTGSSLLYLTGTSNTYTGGTVIEQGTIRIQADGSLGAVPGAFDGANITLNGGILKNNGPSVDLVANRGVTVTASGGRIDVRGGTTMTINGVISGSGVLEKHDGGELIFTAQNTFDGEILLTNGTLTLDATAGNTLAATNTLSIGRAGGTAFDTELNVNSDQTLAQLNYRFDITGTVIGNTTNIASAATLTTGGFINGIVDSGTHSDSTTTAATLTMTGGKFVVNSGSTDISIGIVDSQFGNERRNYTLDLTGLNEFEATTTGTFYLSPGGRDDADLILAATSTITADAVSLGGWNSTPTMKLGETTFIHADTITLGGNLPSAAGNANGGQSEISFQSGLTAPVLTIRDLAGTGRADLIVGMGGTQNTANTGTLDLTGGTVDALLDEVFLGDATNRAGGIGILTFEAGTLDATSLSVGRTSEVGTDHLGTGTLNQNGGTLTVGTLILADEQAGDATAIYNLAAGRLEATTIDAGDGTAVTFNWTGGTIANLAGSDLSIESDVSISVTGANNQVFDAEASQTITVAGVLSGTGGYTKAGEGTLDLTGANTYDAPTVIAEGTFLLNGSLISGTPGTITVQGDATLGGTGITNATINAAGTVNPGITFGDLATGDLNLGAGSTYTVEIDGITPGDGSGHHDQVAVTGSIDLKLTPNVVLVTNRLAEDQDTIDFLTTNFGANVTTGLFSSFSQAEQDILEAADLVIVSRATNSGDYTNSEAETAFWETLETPTILMSSFLARSSRWDWVDTGGLASNLSAAGNETAVTTSGRSDPLFEGVATPADLYNSNYDAIVSAGVGDGKILATGGSGGHIIAARWNAGDALGADGRVAGGDRIFIGSWTGHNVEILTPEGHLVLQRAVGELLSPTLEVTVTSGPVAGASYVIVDNDGTADAVTGMFRNLAESATVTATGGEKFTISYVGGDGNDVVLFGGVADANVAIDGSGNLVISDIGSDSSDDLTISRVTIDSTEYYEISDSDSSRVFSTTGIERSDIMRPNASTVRVATAKVTGGLIVNAASATPTFAVGSVTIASELTLTGEAVINAQTIVVNENLTASGVTLNAAAAGGSVSMAASAVIDAGSGDIDIDADGAVTLAVLTTTGNLAIDTNTGSITDIGAGFISIGGTADLTTTSGSADIILDQLDVTGSIALNASGTATIVNATGIDLRDSTVGGDLAATATSGDLNIAADVIVTSTTGGMTLNASGNFTFDVRAVLNAAGAVEVNLDPGVADGTGVVVNFLGRIDASAAVINGGQDEDVFRIQPSETTEITVHGHDPTTLPGDALVVLGPNPQLASTGTGKGTYTFPTANPALQPVHFTGIESDNLVPVLLGVSISDSLVHGVGQGPIALFSNIQVTQANLVTSATIQIHGGYQPDEDRLSAIVLPAGLSQRFDRSSGTLTISAGPGGVSAKAMEQALRAVAYSNKDLSDPTPGTRWFVVEVQDGTDRSNALQVSVIQEGKAKPASAVEAEGTPPPTAGTTPAGKEGASGELSNLQSLLNSFGDSGVFAGVRLDEVLDGTSAYQFLNGQLINPDGVVIDPSTIRSGESSVLPSLPPAFSLTPFFAGTSAVGAQIIVTISDGAGGFSYTTTVQADAAGNWSASLSGVTLEDRVYSITIQEVSPIFAMEGGSSSIFRAGSFRGGLIPGLSTEEELTLGDIYGLIIDATIPEDAILQLEQKL